MCAGRPVPALPALKPSEQIVDSAEPPCELLRQQAPVVERDDAHCGIEFYYDDALRVEFPDDSQAAPALVAARPTPAPRVRP